MHTKQSLKRQLKQLGIEPTDTILVHSSMKKIGDVLGGAETVLDALSERLSEGLLVLPTHTWSTVTELNPYFDVEKSKVCVGILPELFRKRPGVIRSLHPTHSVAALGKEAASFTDGDETFDTPVAEGSPLWKLLGRQGKIVLIGCNFTSNTFIHGVEEWNDIPGRLTNDHESLYTILADGTKLSVPSRRHCGLSWSKHYFKVEDVLFERGTITQGRFGSADVIVCDAVRLNQDLSSMLKINPALFSTIEPLDKSQADEFITI